MSALSGCVPSTNAWTAPTARYAQFRFPLRCSLSAPQHAQPLVIFTADPDKAFSEFTPNDIPFKDPKLSIAFETQDMMEESLILLRFNCSDPSCAFIANGWNDLKMHVRALHGRQLWSASSPSLITGSGTYSDPCFQT